MRLVTFAAVIDQDTSTTRGRRRMGAMIDDFVVDLAAVVAVGGPNVSARTVRQLLRGGKPALAGVMEALAWASARRDPDWFLRPQAYRLLAPIARPGKLLAIAGNYAAHRVEHNVAVADARRALPEVFWKPSTTIIGPDGTIVLPGELCPAVDYEGELAVIVGTRTRNVAPEHALARVAGYMNFNDVSGRRIEPGIEREVGPRTRFFDWLLGKWFDTFGACGPWLVTADDVPDPQDLALETRVNGEVRQRASTGQMIHSVAELISWISRVTTLELGDIIITGTPEGVGSVTGRFLQAGDVVGVEIGPLGTLRNSVGPPR
jgi:2-keto-4-pentenoate hydratase/2-oxohepta-3-ene-1,7-dioic acid hydratase in catechol pathway